MKTALILSTLFMTALPSLSFAALPSELNCTLTRTGDSTQGNLPPVAIVPNDPLTGNFAPSTLPGLLSVMVVTSFKTPDGQTYQIGAAAYQYQDPAKASLNRISYTMLDQSLSIKTAASTNGSFLSNHVVVDNNAIQIVCNLN
jgi:hypothetical protein